MSIFQLLNGLTFAALLFVVASGFTLIFGLMSIVNLAHGALYLFGGYLAMSAAMKGANFFAAMAIAAGGDSASGLALYPALRRLVQGLQLRPGVRTLRG